AWDLLSSYGWSVIASPWNRELQLWILGEVARRVLTMKLVIDAVNILLGPWQVMVGTRKINLLAALPATLSFLVRHAVVSITVLALNFGVVYGLTLLAEQTDYQGWAALLICLLQPVLWASLIALLAPETPAPASVLRPQATSRPRGMMAAPARRSAATLQDAVPGLMPRP
ncbi:MAG: hypothetical protein ABI743_15200, partial [bacterium]